MEYAIRTALVHPCAEGGILCAEHEELEAVYRRMRSSQLPRAEKDKQLVAALRMGIEFDKKREAYYTRLAELAEACKELELWKTEQLLATVDSDFLKEHYRAVCALEVSSLQDLVEHTQRMRAIIRRSREDQEIDLERWLR